MIRMVAVWCVRNECVTEPVAGAYRVSSAGVDSMCLDRRVDAPGFGPVMINGPDRIVEVFDRESEYRRGLDRGEHLLA